MVLRGLRRITTGGTWIPEIDGLRFVAIFSVFVFHLGGELAIRSGRIIPVEPRFQWVGSLLGNGDRGVILFFVISGMILGLPFARHYLTGAKPVILRKYYIRRVTRLEPPYLLAILISAVLIAVYTHTINVGFLEHMLATMFYQHNLIYGSPSSIDMVTWSLEVEIQFYILAPLFMQIYRIRNVVLRRGLILVVMAIAGFAQEPYYRTPHVYLSIFFYFQYFLAGLLLADVFVVDLERIQSSFLWDIAGLCGFALLFTAPHDSYWPHAVMPFTLVLIVVSAMRSLLLRRFFALEFVAVLGGMCYSIYLLHFIWIAVLFKVTRHAIVANASFPVNLAIQLIVTGIPSVLLCVLFFVLIERPCMDPNWPSKAWRRLTGKSAREVGGWPRSDVSI